MNPSENEGLIPEGDDPVFRGLESISREDLTISSVRATVPPSGGSGETEIAEVQPGDIVTALAGHTDPEAAISPVSPIDAMVQFLGGNKK